MRYYQLTHDFLVPTLREWLHEKLAVTAGGRAKLLLEERAAFWGLRPESRHLLSFSELTRILWWTRSADRGAPQQMLVQRSLRFQGIRLLLASCLLLGLLWLGSVYQRRQQAQQLVQRIAGATPQLLRPLLVRADQLASDVDPVIQTLVSGGMPADENGSSVNAEMQLKLRLALCRSAGEQVPRLEAAVFDGTMDYLPVIFWRLRDIDPGLTTRMEAVLADDTTTADRRFRAALGLLGLGGRTADSAWTESELQVLAEAILDSDEFSRSAFLSLLEPMTELLRPLLEPRLASIPGRSPELLDRRLAAADFLLRAGARRGDQAFRLISFADASLFRILYRRSGESAASLALRAQASINDAARLPAEPLGRARNLANCRLLLLLDALTSNRWPVVGRFGEELSDCLLTADASGVGVTFEMLEAWLEQETTLDAQRVILLVLGSMRLDVAERERALSRVKLLVQNTADVGVFSAAVWLIRQWSLESADAASLLRDVTLAAGDVSPQAAVNRGWFWNATGQMMSAVDLVDFTAGLQGFDAVLQVLPDETPRQVRIRRRIAVSACETTRREWQAFLRDQGYKELPEPVLNSFSPDPDCPAISVGWFEAAEYCNWLSQRDGIPEDQWCFLPNSLGLYADGMQIRKNAVELTGYRLPTEDEWEYFSGGGSALPWFFGYSPENHAQYAWSTENGEQQSHPVGWLRPNQFGLFDVLGNAQEWCLDSLNPPSESPGSDNENVMQDDLRNCRGGGFLSLPKFCRSSRRFACSPIFPTQAHGIRVVRTLSSGSSSKIPQ
jgi:formylglycine-generating enzyme required for sulfatase activity